ncbi:MAG: hypothetical protein DRQ37_07840 [Gammaproteobacteria bacterium]|nr:MAG: hypothetical protein DRQ37_07840 [Gammaproteobacteria bacterium]
MNRAYWCFLAGQEQYEMVKAQFARAEKLQDRAEAIQETSAKIMGVVRKSMFIILPIIFVLVIYLTWIILR